MSEYDVELHGTKKLQCQQCRRSFTRPENLSRHMRTHDALQKHKCQICQRQFSRSDLKRKHELLHQRAASRVKTKSTAQRVNTQSIAESLGVSIDEHVASPQLHDSAENIYPGLVTTAADLDLSAPEAFQDRPGGQQDLDLPGGTASAINHDAFFDARGAGNSQPDAYFDFLSFARPWNYTPDHTDNDSSWFSDQFFAAIRETDLAYSPSSLQDWTGAGMPHVEAARSRQHGPYISNESTFGGDQAQPTFLVGHFNHSPLHRDFAQQRQFGGLSRVSSPPNEESHEDHVPFAWNPRSAPVATAKPIVLPSDDPIFKLTEKSLQLSAETLSGISNFLSIRGSHGPDAFTVPSLSLVNVFVSLFFKRFLPQAPVLHTSSTDINALPAPLLAIIMVVGSTYSHLRHTRRFGIILFDRIRQNLLALVEADNGLMREPLIIYALTLTCFMGLWCGNKRAFELAEALRGSVVTYARRLPANRSASTPLTSSTSTSDSNETLQSRWLRWIAVESQKRLCWFVFTLDSEFFSILGMSGMMTQAEIRRWNSPCDEDYWNAPTSRAWKNLLGEASEPPCPVYGQMIASLLTASTCVSEGSHYRFLPRTNNWNAKLLLTAVMAEVFHAEQTALVLRMSTDGLDECSLPYSPHGISFTPQNDGVDANLCHSLSTWHEAYACADHSPRSDPTSAYFRRAATIVFHLARLYLGIPLSDIQDCLGRSGPADARSAMSRLVAWAARAEEEAYSVVENAAVCIAFIMSSGDETAPYDIIGVFLSHVAIWAIAKATGDLQRAEIVRRLQHNRNIPFEVCEFVEAGFVALSSNGSAGAPQLILKHAIQILVQIGTWGASSNLALLLHHIVMSD